MFQRPGRRSREGAIKNGKIRTAKLLKKSLEIERIS